MPKRNENEVKKGQNIVDIVLECPLSMIQPRYVSACLIPNSVIFIEYNSY